MGITPAEEAAIRPDRRPEARSFSIEDLLGEIRSGRIRVPPFQRGLRWTDDDRLNLFDSIYRGFPIGALLFWRRPAEAGRVEIGRLIIDAELRSDALWVVDGQQRVTTLADVLIAGPGPDPEGRTIRFDLEEPRFAYGTATQKASPRWIPLSEVHDSVRLLAWAHEQRLAGRALSLALDLGKRLRETQVPAYIVDGADEQVLRQIFDRTNSSGKPLKAHEVFDALHGAQTSAEPSSLREIARALGGFGFGRIAEDLVLRSLLAVRRKDPGRDFRQIANEDMPAALAETISALGQAVIFVRNTAQFPHIELLPYKLPLATLALFFHEHADPSPRTRRLLTRWLWRGAISGSHSGNTVALRRTLNAIVPESEERAVQNLLAEAGTRPTEPLALQPFNFRHARTKLQLVALAALGPRHLATGEELDVAELCEQEDGPALRLSSKNRTLEEGGLANRILHPQVVGSSLRRQLAVVSDEKTLRSHLVSTDSQQALRQGDFAQFLRLRESDLHGYVDSFLDSKADWEASDRDRPSLSSLMVLDE
ncbi:MAG TPA: DUF262 domain-containing protein [Thermoanaerobaculia bacterium]|jgi:hypothetical protein|nr:DUF262 domain-containing protein [Thermoanaerobaculia bacterium]